MSTILKGSTPFIVQIMLLLSIVVVLRGHNYPGGGFIGALIASAAVGLDILTFERAQRLFTWQTRMFLIAGLFGFLISTLLAVFWQNPLLTSLWWQFYFLGETIKIGTPLLFDFSIYFIIFGSLSWLFDELEQEYI